MYIGRERDSGLSEGRRPARGPRPVGIHTWPGAGRMTDTMPLDVIQI